MLLCVEAGDNETWVVPGGRDAAWGNLGIPGQIYWFKEQKWTNFSYSNIPELYETPDMCEIAINPKNSKQVFFGSYGGRIIEFNNGAITAHYTETNSGLAKYLSGSEVYQSWGNSG